MENAEKMHKTSKKEIYCNCCGRPIVQDTMAHLTADYLHIEKAWGYFSSKDLTGHAFNVCEDCYDKWIQKFKIPVEEFPVDEVHNYTEEEIEMINAAYAEVLGK